jgi:type I restriction enzyme S subunit
MSQVFPLRQIKDAVLKVESWNPVRDGADRLINYIDLGSVDQNTKTVNPNEPIIASSAPSRARQLVQARDVLVSTVRPNLNGVAVVDSSLDRATASTGFCVLRPDTEKIDGSYLFHWVKTPSFISDMVRKATGASYPAVSDRIVFESRIPLPPIAEQRRIAAILDKAEELRELRRQALRELDAIAQSIFIEMFGDPVSNPKGWNVCSAGSFIIDVTNGLTRRRKESDQGTDIVLRLRDIRAGWIDFSEVNRISLERQESGRYEVTQGDLLFIRVNGNPNYVGRCAIFSGLDEPVYFNDHIMRVKTDPLKVDGKFLVFTLNGTLGKREIAAHRKTSAGQHTINQTGLSKIGLNHRFGHSGRTACLISKVSSMRDRALRYLVQMNYSVNG